MYIDTHAHIYENNYDDIEKIIENAKNNKVFKVVNVSENIDTSNKVINITKRHNDFFFSAVGIHPLYAEEENDIKLLERIIKENNVDFIGEIGLDYHYENISKDKQMVLFDSQLSLAEKYNLPVIIHTRNAIEDTIRILKSYKIKGIVHCFNGSAETAREFIKLGFFLGIGGIVTFKNSKLIETIKKIGINSLVYETDSPFLTPEPFRKEKNESKYVAEIVKYISKSLDITIEELLNSANKNLEKLLEKNT